MTADSPSVATEGMSEYMSTDIDRWGRYKSLGKFFYFFIFFKKLRKNQETHRMNLRGNFGHLRGEKESA